MCRGRMRYFSTYTSPFPNADSASLRASENDRSNSSASLATRMPLPPPPAAALMITGKPIDRANSSASSTSSTGPGVPGTIGTPTAVIALRAAALSPMTRICSAVGPMKVMFEASQISANSAFSARNPYPGWIASAPVISAAAMMRGILRYESRAAGGPMQTSSSAKRTCSDSRSASEYTATVCTPSSRHARMTRSAISPRFAIRTFLNTGAPRGRRSFHCVQNPLKHVRASRSPVRGFASRACRVMGSRLRVRLEARPAVVARASHALHPQRELARAGGIEHRAFVGDDTLRIVMHERLVETLHPVLNRAFLDQVGDVQRLVHVADLIADGLRVHEHLAGGDATRLVRTRYEAERDDRLQRAGEREAHLGLLVRRVERQHAVDRLRRVRRVEGAEHEVARVRRLQRGVQRLEVADLADQDDVRILAKHAAQRLAERGRVG